MRKHLKDLQEVAHYWANRVQPEGEAGNLFYRTSELGSMIYIYGSHFCIARLLPAPSNVVILTTRGYSPSTARHVSIVRRAASHLPLVYCNDPMDNAFRNMGAARRAIRDSLFLADKRGIRQATREGHKAAALRIAEQANAYLAALPEADSRGEQPIDTTDLEAVRARMVEAEQAAVRIRAEQHAAELGDLQESLRQWRAHEIVTRTGLSRLPCALRLHRLDILRGDGTFIAESDRGVIQTSHGAEIPVSFAPRIWRSVQATRAQGVDYVPREPAPMIGAYRLSQIRADGSMVVGCHDIPYSELEGIAQALGYTVNETEGV